MSILNMNAHNPIGNLEKLNYDNSTDWFQSVQDYFVLNGLWSCLDDDFLDENFDDFGNKFAANSKNLKVLAILRSLVDDQMKKKLNDFKDSKSAWQHLKSFYSNKIVEQDIKIVEKINDFQIQGDSLIKNFDQFDQFFNQFEKILTLDDFKLNSFCLKLSKDQQYKSVVKKLQGAKNVNHFRDILNKLQTTNAIVSDFQSPNILSESQNTNNRFGNQRNEENKANSMIGNASRQNQNDQNNDNSKRRNRNEENDANSITGYAIRRKNQNGQKNNSREQNGQRNDNRRERNGQRNDDSRRQNHRNDNSRKQNQNRQDNNNNSIRQNNNHGNKNQNGQRSSRDSNSSSMNQNDNYSRRDDQKNNFRTKNQLDYGRTDHRDQRNLNRDDSPRNKIRSLISFGDSDNNSMASHVSDSLEEDSSEESNRELNIINQYMNEKNELNKSNSEDKNSQKPFEKDVTPSSSNQTAIKPPTNRFYNATYNESKNNQKRASSDWSTSDEEGTIINCT